MFLLSEMKLVKSKKLTFRFVGYLLSSVWIFKNDEQNCFLFYCPVCVCVFMCEIALEIK